MELLTKEASANVARRLESFLSSSMLNWCSNLQATAPYRAWLLSQQVRIKKSCICGVWCPSQVYDAVASLVQSWLHAAQAELKLNDFDICTVPAIAGTCTYAALA